jgi:hypothetical protein
MLAACGGSGSSSGSEEAEGTYRVKVTEASFPTEQRLGQTSLMRLGIRNTGDETVPALTVSITIDSREGRDSSLPFGISDPTAGVAQADRPIWVLSEGYPRFGDSSDPGGASSSNRKTFVLGPLKPGKTTDAVWKLSAVRPGDYTLVYGIDAGLSGNAKAKTEGGVAPGGSFVTEISTELPDVEVTDSGEVIEKQQQRQRGDE